MTKLSICDTVKYCKNCREKIDNYHKCGYVWCNTCSLHYEKYTQHDCYIRQVFPHQLKEPQEKFIFYDFETYGKTTQYPYYCVVWKPTEKPVNNNYDENDFYTFKSTFEEDNETMKTIITRRRHM